jgi:very-short-patch-repair endonuclease
MPNMKKYNWSEIQTFHDAGNTWKEIQKHFGVCQAAISLARKRGDFISRNHSDANKIAYKKGRGCKKHSEQTKRKISKARIKYLTENPDKVPYLINHSSKKSYPEQIFENALISANITGWQYAYQNGIYEYDFAWPEQKIDVEIDGSTHLSEKVKKIDRRRDKFSKKNGWVVLRFTADKVKTDVLSCINLLLSTIDGRSRTRT